MRSQCMLSVYEIRTKIVEFTNVVEEVCIIKSQNSWNLKTRIYDFRWGNWEFSEVSLPGITRVKEIRGLLRDRHTYQALHDLTPTGCLVTHNTSPWIPWTLWSSRHLSLIFGLHWVVSEFPLCHGEIQKDSGLCMEFYPFGNTNSHI